jgi:hypothetical protein
MRTRPRGRNDKSHRRIPVHENEATSPLLCAQPSYTGSRDRHRNGAGGQFFSGLLPALIVTVANLFSSATLRWWPLSP